MLRRLLFIAFVITVYSMVWADFEIDLESGAVFTGYNNIRIPGDQGTKFSLKDDLESDIEPYLRLRLNYSFNPKHHISLLFAPLTVKAKGKVNRDLDYKGEIFPANTSLKSIYQFNSYRISYRYDFVNREKVTFGIGFTAKIRDAKISIENDTLKTEKENVGFVPILNFKLNWQLRQLWWIIFEGDALAAPQGRAEDVALSLYHQFRENLGFRIGYRLLEGGADNDEVYTFSLFHYAAFGLSYKF